MINKLHSLPSICAAFNLPYNSEDTSTECASTIGQIINVVLKSKTELNSAFFDNLDHLISAGYTVHLYPTKSDLFIPTKDRRLDSSLTRLTTIKSNFLLYADGLINDSKQDKLDFKTAYKYLDYAPETGVISWKLDINPMVPKGTSGGFKHSSGQHIIKIDGEVYRLNRVIWLLQTGIWPTGRIKHKDSDPNNLKWNNLYEEKAEK